MVAPKSPLDEVVESGGRESFATGPGRDFGVGQAPD